MTYVYVIQAKDGPVKIGRALDPETRCRVLAVGSPFTLSLVYKQPCGVFAEQVEVASHQRLFAHRTRGEWFAVPAERAIRTIQRAARVFEPKERCQMTIMITPAQSRMARAALNVGTDEIRKLAGLGANTLNRFENGGGILAVTMEKLVLTYQAKGIEFPDTETVRIGSPQEVSQAA